MFKLDVNYIDALIRNAQQTETEDPVKKVTQMGLQSSCTIFAFSDKKQWSGSGFHLGNGYILTANHVVDSELNISELKITFDGKNYFNAEFIKGDYTIDSAVIYCKEAANIVPGLKLGNSDSLEVGDLVIVVSAPEGFHDTATFGRISNIHQSVKNVQSPAWNDIIFIDADILEGSSGGMVLGTDGLVYGIVMGVTGSHAEIGIGENSVSPSNKIKALVGDLV